MNVLHTSDWHLGKNLESRSRLEEQRQFIDELIQICSSYKVDAVIVAGDIFDTFNPSAEAEVLFYDAVYRLSDSGNRPLIVIAGNHDNSERLAAARPLALSFGITIVSKPQNVELNINGETAIVSCVPYLSDKRLNELISDATDEKTLQTDYSNKIGQIFQNLSKAYRTDTINIAAGHFYVAGGDTSSSERDITLGGVYAVNTNDLPKEAAYIAMGHLHKNQKIKNGCYSGSPIQYSKSETGYAKCVVLVTLEAGASVQMEKIYLRNYKPIEIVTAASAYEALEKLQIFKEKECYIYLEISGGRLDPSDIRVIREMKCDVIDINLTAEYNNTSNTEMQEYKEKTISEEFVEFYLHERGIEPSEDMLTFFKMIVEEDADETVEP